MELLQNFYKYFASSVNNAKIHLMLALAFALQIISGIVTVFFILIKEPKSEGLGAIGSNAHSFKGVRTSADEKLDQMIWIFAGIFLFSSLYLAFAK